MEEVLYSKGNGALEQEGVSSLTKQEIHDWSSMQGGKIQKKEAETSYKEIQMLPWHVEMMLEKSKLISSLDLWWWTTSFDEEQLILLLFHVFSQAWKSIRSSSAAVLQNEKFSEECGLSCFRLVFAATW